MSRPNGLFTNPQTVAPKLYMQNFYPYYLLTESCRGKRILDIGFGYGHGSFYLAEIAAKVVAIDSDEENLNNAKNKFVSPNLDYLLMDATNLNFPDSNFDLACSFQVIEHIREDLLLKYLSEIHRVLKQGGIFCISTLNKAVTMKPGQFYNKNPYHKKEFNAKELKFLLAKVFPQVEIFGLQLTLKHNFFQRLKKSGIFRPFPKMINPVERFYGKVGLRDFKISKNNLNKSLDFICFCYKNN